MQAERTGDISAIQQIGERLAAELEAKNEARDRALAESRTLIRHCSLAIRATHRADFAEAERIIELARGMVATSRSLAARFPDLYWAGYVQDAQKEYAEACLTFAVVRGQPLPEPAELGVEVAPYLNGLGEMCGELRRYILDIVRHGGQLATCEALLVTMEEVYSLLVTFDFPDAITNGLRRTTDLVRGVLERTRGDLTLIVRQQELELALRGREARA